VVGKVPNKYNIFLISDIEISAFDIGIYVSFAIFIAYIMNVSMCGNNLNGFENTKIIHIEKGKLCILVDGH